MKPRGGWLRSLRARFVLSHIVPMLVVIPIVGIALTYLLGTQVLLASLSNELERQAGLVAAAAVAYPQVWFDQTQARAFTALVGERLTAQVALVDPSGTLLATTDPADQGLVGQKLQIAGLSEALATGQIVRVNYGEQPGTGAAEVLLPVFVNGRISGVIRLTDPLSSVYARFPRTRALIVGVLAAGLLVGVGIGWFLALSLERPLGRATEAITRMSGGEPLTQLPEQGPQEIRLLLRAFNTLTGQLRSLEKARRRLLANLVHEIGRPLGALLSAAQALRGGADEDPDLRRELVAGMEVEVAQMRHVLDDLTHLYDRTIGPLELDRRPVDLRVWLAQAVVPWREAAQNGGLSWQAAIPSDLPEVQIDGDRLASALGNVLSNAIKFTPSGGGVTVSAGAEGNEVWIRVHDTGPGISPEELGRIFVPFYRGAAGRRFPQGMGLGLSIARDVVSAHDGRITVESDVGKGTAFTIWLPVTFADVGELESSAIPVPAEQPSSSLVEA